MFTSTDSKKVFEDCIIRYHLIDSVEQEIEPGFRIQHLKSRDVIMTGPISWVQRNPIGALPSSIAAVAGHRKVASLLDAGFRCRRFVRVENQGHEGKNQSNYQPFQMPTFLEQL